MSHSQELADLKNTLTKALLIMPKEGKYINSLLEYIIHQIIRYMYNDEYQHSTVEIIHIGPLNIDTEWIRIHSYKDVYMGFSSLNNVSEIAKWIKFHKKVYVTSVGKDIDVDWGKYKNYFAYLYSHDELRLYISHVNIKFPHISFSNTDKKLLWEKILEIFHLTLQDFLDFGDIIPKELIINMYEIPKKYYDVKFSYYYA